MLSRRDFPDTRPSLLRTLRGAEPQESAWREFFERYAPAVYHVARLRGVGAHEAEDVVQQVMIAIAGRISRFRYDRDRGHFRQWVRRIAENKICNLNRKRRPVARDAALLEDQADDRPRIDEVWEQEWRLQDLLWCLEQVSAEISPRRMQAFRMYALEGVPAAVVAERLDMTMGYVYVTRNQVLNLVRARMSELAEDRH